MERNDEPPREWTAEEDEVLRGLWAELLADRRGGTSEVALARRHGVSDRTVRRWVGGVRPRGAAPRRGGR